MRDFWMTFRRSPLLTAVIVAAVSTASACGAANNSVTAGSATTGSASTTPSSIPPNPKIPTVTPFYPSPDLKYCGPGFFDSQTTAAIAAEFGPVIVCGGFPGADRWIVLTAGTPGPVKAGSEPPSAPYGTYVVAVDTCASSNSACLSPTTAHSFSGFTVYQPPVASALVSGHDIGGTWGSRIIGLTDGACTPVLFDTFTGRWFPEGGPNHIDSRATITDIMTGHVSAATQFPRQSPGEAGTAALAGAHPTGFARAASFPTTCPD